MPSLKEKTLKLAHDFIDPVLSMIGKSDDGEWYAIPNKGYLAVMHANNAVKDAIARMVAHGCDPFKTHNARHDSSIWDSRKPQKLREKHFYAPNNMRLLTWDSILCGLEGMNMAVGPK